MKQSKELYRILVDQAGVGIFVTDYDYHLTNVNPWICIMFGYTKEELIMGLGMSIVHSIVMSSNGTISVANNPGGPVRKTSLVV
ncbi:PAS domain S-box protein [Desulforamulus reducens]|uniref:PAS domain S-box protein n=1 Tax=Desulforamulus reducens TaxID=59610 RepID=UPI001EE4705F|nr:PAS domain S-box protein [Desulforamulus reducens]